MLDDAPSPTSLASLGIGSRLVVRSRSDWRFAAVSRVSEERVTLTVCSPGGRTYRLSRTVDAEVRMCGSVPVLMHNETDEWRDNFGRYDTRW